MNAVLPVVTELRDVAAVPGTPRLLTRDETAKVLRVSTRLVDALIGRGELRSLLVGDRRLVKAEDLAAFIEAQAAKG